MDHLHSKKVTTAGLLITLGIIFGDIGTSPLYTFQTILAEGGKVDMPLAKQFWGDTYSQLIDKFGVHWMVNIASAEPKKA